MIKSKILRNQKYVSHYFFNRLGGTSKGIYKSLNCGKGSKDKIVNINKNLKIVSKKIGCNSENLVSLNQIHSNKVHKINNVPKKIRVFPSPQTVSLTVIGGVQRIASIDPEAIKVYINFNDWSSQTQFYEPKVNLPSGLLNWKDISPKSLEIAVAREIR